MIKLSYLMIDTDNENVKKKFKNAKQILIWTWVHAFKQ